MGLAQDLKRLKEDGLRRVEAKTETEVAKARELMAKAVEAENKATMVSRNDRISQAEELQKLAKAAKTNAEARVLLSKAELEQAKARVEAWVHLVEAVSKLQAKGGGLGVNPEGLKRMLKAGGFDDFFEDPSAPPTRPTPPNNPKGPGPGAPRPKGSGRGKKKR
jgi:hypothetical protein